MTMNRDGTMNPHGQHHYSPATAHAVNEIERLRAINAELVGALRTVSEWCEHNGCGAGTSAEPFWLESVNTSLAKVRP